MLNRCLFKHIDNSALIIFRVFFGLLITLESFGAIVTGWVRRTLVEPEFTFSFIDFYWLQPLPGNWMYVYFSIMGIFGFCVMLGYKYRFSIIAFTLLWAGVYFMQKASYNNHYYLLVLLSLIMSILPANRYFSLDAKNDTSIIKHNMPQWCSLVLILQMAIVYTYASIAKIYPDWLDTTVMDVLMKSKKDYYVIGALLQQKWLHYLLAYGGILFDLLIIPALLWKPTRKGAFIIAVCFHLFNSLVFQIGIFPYMSIALCVFFFHPKTIQNIFLKNKPFYSEEQVIIPSYKPFLVAFLSFYFIIQIALPLRHWFIKDNVFWTEEAHRLSWRMMLRSRSGIAHFTVVDKETNEKTVIKLDDYVTKKQKRIVSSRPDVIWQFAQRLKQKFKTEGKDVSVFVDCKVSVNRKPFKQFIDPKVDLTTVKWNAFKHHEWILPSNED